MYFKNASAGLYKDYSDIEGCIGSMMDIVTKTPGMIYQVNTLGGRIQDKASSQTSSFAYRNHLFFSELQTYWEQPSQGKKLMEKFAAVQQVVSSHGITAQYRNYPDGQFKDPLSSYYGENLSKLKKVKSKYDPEDVFHYEQSIRS